MKKNFNVNIGGIIFHIDEDAFEKLEHYQLNLRLHFEGTEGREEILNDIEIRFAEMLQSRLSDAKQVIVMEDIDFLIAAMGQPTDFGDSDESHSYEKTNRPKRFYRDPENKVISGVCSGLAAYFHVDPLWIRLAFVLITFAGVGTPILAYCILWLIIPQANTTTERLEMRGEKVNISNIEKSIKEEFGEMSNRINDLGKEAKDVYMRNRKTGKNIFEKVFAFLMEIVNYFFRAIVVLFGVFFLIIGLFLLIGILISMIDTGNVLYVSSFGISTFSLPVFLRIFLDTKDQSIAIAGLFLVIVIPLLMLIYTGARLIFGFKSRSRFVGIPAFSLFIGGLIISGFMGFGLLKSFNHKAIDERDYKLIQPQNNTLTIGLKTDKRLETLGYDEKRWGIGNWNMISSGDTNIYFGLPTLEFIRSESDSFQISMYAMARGENYNQGLIRAKKVIYQFSQSDTLLSLNPYFFLPSDEKYRGQKVKLVVKVPVGKSIKLLKETSMFFENHLDENVEDISGRKWIMQENGLKDIMNKTQEVKADTLETNTISKAVRKTKT
ncbi:MAG: PspC domain-containing protein [Bacteroidota bacterium]